VLAANAFQLADLFHDRSRRIAVVELQVAFGVRVQTAREDARVERAAEQNADFALFALRQQVVEDGLFEQRVSSGEERAVDVELGHGFPDHRSFVHAKSDCLHAARLAQFVQCAKSAVVGELPPVKGVLLAVRHAADVVNQHDVDIHDAETLLAVFERAQDAVVAVVVDRFER
jgi:hypothetical protein